MPLRPATYLRLAEHVWGEAGNREVQDAFMVGLLRHRELPVVQQELVPTFTRWLGFVYPWGFHAHFEKDHDKLAESRRELEQRLGQAAAPGPVKLLEVQLEVVDNIGLLRLAQVAVAVISHGNATGYIPALLTGIVATTVMDGSHAEFSWLLHTCSAQIRQALLQHARDLLALQQPTAYLAARWLLAYLGDAQATGMQGSIPAEHRCVHSLAKMREDDPCAPILGPWQKDNYQNCLARNRDDPHLVVRQLKALACDPDIVFPADLGQQMDQVGSGINFSRTSLSMGTSVEEHQLDEMEPALCAIAPGRYQYLMRAWMRTFATRNGLPRRQLAWRLLEHLPVLGEEEKGVVLAAWRAARMLDHEHDKTAELALYPAVVFDLPPEEQLQRLTERGDVVGHFTQRAPCYRPLEPGHGPAILAALKTTEGEATPQRLYNLLLYLTEALRHVVPQVQQYLLGRFGALDTVARGCCLELFVRTRDAVAAQQIVASGWRAQGGKENYLEDTWGSILLAEFGNALPFADLALRLDRQWLGAAVQQRGYRADDLTVYAGLLDSIWHSIADKTPPPEVEPQVESLSQYVVLKVNPATERQPENVGIHSGDGGASFANYTWGGSAGSSGDFRLALDPHARLEKHNALAQQVQAMVEDEYRNGNPWFAHGFRDGGLVQVCALAHQPWREWIAPVLRDDRRAWQLLRLCRGFYEKLCAALLIHAPQEGLELYQALSSRQTVRITDARLGIPTLLMDAFAAPASPQLEQILRAHMDAGTSDLDLFERAMLCQRGGRLEWMRQLIGQWQSSDLEYDHARALALLGFSCAPEDGAALVRWIDSHADCWLRGVAQTALQNQQKCAWARCWFGRFLERENRTEAWAAFRLFLRCVDRRFWFWFNRSALDAAQPWKRDAFSMNLGALEDACKENEKEWQANFLGQKVKPRELWPWMDAYR